jgi:hypothetical protein
MADIGKPIKRYTVVPLSEPVPETKEPQQAPAPERERQPERQPA